MEKSFQKGTKKCLETHMSFLVVKEEQNRKILQLIYALDISDCWILHTLRGHSNNTSNSFLIYGTPCSTKNLNINIINVISQRQI